MLAEVSKGTMGSWVKRAALALLLGATIGLGGCVGYYPDDPYYGGPEYGYAPAPAVGYPAPVFGSIDLNFGGGGHGYDRGYRPGYRDRPSYRPPPAHYNPPVYRGNPGWDRHPPEHRGGPGRGWDGGDRGRGPGWNAGDRRGPGRSWDGGGGDRGRGHGRRETQWDYDQRNRQ